MFGLTDDDNLQYVEQGFFDQLEGDLMDGELLAAAARFEFEWPSNMDLNSTNLDISKNPSAFNVLSLPPPLRLQPQYARDLNMKLNDSVSTSSIFESGPSSSNIVFLDPIGAHVIVGAAEDLSQQKLLIADPRESSLPIKQSTPLLKATKAIIAATNLIQNFGKPTARSAMKPRRSSRSPKPKHRD